VRRQIVGVCLLAVAGIAGAAIAETSLTAAVPSLPDTARVQFQSGTTAFVFWPAGRDSAPGMVVVHEWWGLNDQIRSVARRLSQEGYIAVVPDLYHGKVAGDSAYARQLSRGLDETRAVNDLGAAVRWLRAQPRLRRGRVGAIGFGMGGRLSQLLALKTPELSAAVMVCGRPETDPRRLAALRVPLQAHFGAEDHGISADQASALRTGIERSHIGDSVYVYPGAGVAFMNESDSSYHPDGARQAWARTLQFLQKRLKD
jgi:carboxymethylenebutenolidase